MVENFKKGDYLIAFFKLEKLYLLTLSIFFGILFFGDNNEVKKRN